MAANFCKVLASLDFAITRSRRRYGWREFSVGLLRQRRHSRDEALPIDFMATPKYRGSRLAKRTSLLVGINLAAPLHGCEQ